MRDAVEIALRQKNDSLQVSYVDCQTDCAAFIKKDGSIDIPNFLIRQFGLAESYNGYRKSSNSSVQDYIIKNSILQDRIVWVKGMNRHRVKMWIEFCNKFRPDRTDKGLFVIESYQNVPIPILDHITSFYYSVSYYDAPLFNNMVVSTTKRPMEWTQYIATLVAQLCRDDVKLSVALINQDSFENAEPIQSLSEIADSSEFANRSAAENLRGDQPFVLIRKCDESSLNRKVWEAQLRVLYPLLEMERVAFIDAHEEAVREAIDCEFCDSYGNRRHIRQFGEKLNDPYDAEIGTLYGINHMGRADDPYSYVLYIPNETDRNRLSLMHAIRNALAHMNMCNVQQVSDFLNNYPYTCENIPMWRNNNQVSEI